MIAALITLSLHPVGWFASTLEDHLWRWPLIILILSASGLATYPLEKAWRGLRRGPEDRKRKRILNAKLLALTPGEKRIFKAFLVAKSRTGEIPVISGDVPNLVREGMLIQTTDMGYGGVAGIRIAEDVWQHLLEKPELLD